MLNDYGISLEIPAHIQAKMMSSYKNTSDMFPSFHPIWDAIVNNFLSIKLNLATDCPVYNLNNSFRVFFDWTKQIWYIG